MRKDHYPYMIWDPDRPEQELPYAVWTGKKRHAHFGDGIAALMYLANQSKKDK